VTTASPISVQLYTVRDAIAADLPGTLKRIADIGYTQVEPYAFVDRVDEYAEALPAAGLTAHVGLIGKDLEPIFAAATRLGVGTIIDPHIDETRWVTREDVEAIAKELGEIADAAAAHDLTIGYHNHAFELENLIDGTPALEVFAAALPANVVLEIDTYWVEVGGVDAAELLARLGDKVQFLHVKDGPKNKNDVEQVAVGRGSMPVRDILQAARQATPTALADSFEFLQGVRA
jgi:sugar phosphate isomerase/epimerase